MEQNSANWVNRQIESLYYEESKLDWNLEKMSKKIGIEKESLLKCSLLGGWFNTHNIQNVHVQAVCNDLKEKAIFELASSLLNIIGQIDKMPSIMQHHMVIKALGKAYQKISGSICTDKAIEWEGYLVRKCVTISKELGILPSSLIPDEELIDQKWQNVIKTDEKLKIATKNANLNLNLLLNGSARDEMKAKWANVIKTAKKVKIMDDLKGEDTGTGQKLIDLINGR